MSEMDVYKVQLPLARSGPAMALCYKEGGKGTVLVPITDELRKAMKNEFRAFFRATVVDGQIKLGERVKDLGW